MERGAELLLACTLVFFEIFFDCGFNCSGEIAWVSLAFFFQCFNLHGVFCAGHSLGAAASLAAVAEEGTVLQKLVVAIAWPESARWSLRAS